MPLRPGRRLSSAALALITAGSLVALAAPARAADPAPRPEPGSAPPAASGAGHDRTAVPDPDHVLPGGWRTATDRAVTVDGDVNGLHVLVAEESAGYRWRTAATLSEPGYDADQWVGQSCVTGSGRRAVVVYAPRTFTNNAEAMAGGGFVAVVDLVDGTVRKLPIRGSLAYFDPGCGADERFAITSAGGSGTTVRLADAASGRVTSTYAVGGEVTSAVPYAGGVAGVLGRDIVRLRAHGAAKPLVTTPNVPFRLHPDSTGGLAYEVPDGARAAVYRLSGGHAARLGAGALGRLQLAGSAGHVFLLGPDRGQVGIGGLAGWRSVDAAVGSDVSTTGALAVATATPAAGVAPLATSAAPVTIKGTVQGSSQPAVTFQVLPGNPQARGAQSAGVAASPAALAPANDPTDPDRGCAVARNDPSEQAYQASAAQVEWAADLAVKGNLTITRPVNWNNAGNGSSYQIQGANGIFKIHTLAGGGQVPAQVLLGALAQESNTMHASPHAVDGETGNFNQGGFYGNQVSWSTVDCGYGVGQVTTGMTVAEGNSVWNAQQRLAIATDYAANIAASLNMLIDKWNELYGDGILANGGDPQFIENWYLAAWAYNTGVQPNAANGNTTGCKPSAGCDDGAGHWGLGWSNNPSNPNYPVDRGYFNGQIAYDAKHPNLWPYPEKVMGWAYHPVARYNYTGGYWEPAYAAARMSTSSGVPVPTLPGPADLCNANDLCQPGATTDVNGKSGAGKCTLSNLHCWWHFPVTWEGTTSPTTGAKSGCDGTVCGYETVTYQAGAPEPGRPTVYPTDCTTTGLPDGAKIIDDTTVGDPFGGCSGAAKTTGGSFGLTFASSTPSGCSSRCVTYKSKIDFHQIGGTGYDGHYWFAHTIPNTNQALEVTGTWTLNSPNAWTRIFVHLPRIGAQTQQARYRISEPNGKQKYRVIPTAYEAESWVELGVYDLRGSGSPTVSLDNLTEDGMSLDVAWDALAYVPLPKKPADFVVALGDSYSSGEGTGDYYHVTDQYGSNPDLRNACRRSPHAWSRQVTLPGAGSTIGGEADAESAGLAYANIACSGAVTANVTSRDLTDYPWPFTDSLGGQYHELSQMDQGALDENTTLVLMTIGGNDAGFTPTLTACMTGDCTGQEASLIAHIKSDVAPRVAQLVANIHKMAPNALVVIAGYPELFAADASLTACPPTADVATCALIKSSGIALSPAETAMLNRVADAMMVNALPPAGGSSGGGDTLPIDMISPFLGHNIESWGDSGWLNAITVPNFNDSSGEPPAATLKVGMGSFHPTAAGARDGYGATVRQVIDSYYAQR